MFYSTCPPEQEGKRMENNLAYFELLLFMYRLVYGKELDEKTRRRRFSQQQKKIVAKDKKVNS